MSRKFLIAFQFLTLASLASAQRPYLVEDIYPGTIASGLTELTDVGGVLFFRANDGVNGIELWKSDGTPGGTVMVMDITPGVSGTSFSELAAYFDKVFFSANVSPSGSEPWISDGTAAGTMQLADICPGSCSSLPRDAGTLLVKSISGASAPPSKLTVVGSTIFFEAFGSAVGFELYKTDGTTAGTVLVKDISPGGGYGSPTDLTEMGGMLYFRATDGTNGEELWKSDGTTAGTVMIRDIRPGFANSRPEWLTPVNGTLFFSADDGVNGKELWSSDGTAPGTVLRDVRPGSPGSAPTGLHAVGDTLLFEAYEVFAFGDELYKTAAAMSGVRLVADIRRSNPASSPSLLTRSGSRVFFTADGDVGGRELWAVKVDDLDYFTVTRT